MVYGKAINDISKISSIENISVGLHFEFNKELLNDVNYEFNHQIELFNEIVGKKPDHIDSHKIRIHEIPELKEALKNYTTKNLTPVRDMGYAKLIDTFIGLSKLDYKTTDFNKITPKALIEVLNERLVDGYNELMCHAGRVDDSVMTTSSYNLCRDTELNTLLSTEFKNYLETHSEIKLINWKQIPYTK